MNRIDKTVVFKPLGRARAAQHADAQVQHGSAAYLHCREQRRVRFSVTDPAREFAREFLLREGTDLKYGDHHLKPANRTQPRHPLEHLIAVNAGLAVARLALKGSQPKFAPNVDPPPNSSFR
jgi:hypothetical protein